MHCKDTLVHRYLRTKRAGNRRTTRCLLLPPLWILSGSAVFGLYPLGVALFLWNGIGLYLYRGQPFLLYTEIDGGGTREVDDAIFHIGPAIIDLELDRLASLDIGHFDFGP